MVFKLRQVLVAFHGINSYEAPQVCPMLSKRAVVDLYLIRDRGKFKGIYLNLRGSGFETLENFDHQSYAEFAGNLVEFV